MRYRIRAVRPNDYLDEIKGWIFWEPALWSNGFFELYPTKFRTYEEAYRAMIEDAEMRRQKKINRNLYKRKIKAHVSQKPRYFNA